MSEVIQQLASIRESVLAVMRISKKVQGRGKKKPPRIEHVLSFVGTAWCIVPNRLLLTAFHVLNNGELRNPHDLFYAFTVPSNGLTAFSYPIINFHLEDKNNDMAILEIDHTVQSEQSIPSIPITFSRPSDGERVITLGFPAPEISKAEVDASGHFIGGQFFLKKHANKGIVAAQYDIDGCWFYEFNIGWHHGESGGPIFCGNPTGAIAIMQQYRGIKSPFGTMAGPHRGRSLESIRNELIKFPVTIA